MGGGRREVQLMHSQKRCGGQEALQRETVLCRERLSWESAIRRAWSEIRPGQTLPECSRKHGPATC